MDGPFLTSINPKTTTVLPSEPRWEEGHGGSDVVAAVVVVGALQMKSISYVRIDPSLVKAFQTRLTFRLSSSRFFLQTKFFYKKNWANLGLFLSFSCPFSHSNNNLSVYFNIIK